MINCHHCGLPWAKRRFMEHERQCDGKISIGFKSIKKGKRYEYQCQRCFSCLRKEKMAKHRCHQRQDMTKSEKQKLNSDIQPTLTLNHDHQSIKKMHQSKNNTPEDDESESQKEEKSFFFQNEPLEARSFIMTSASGKIIKITDEDLQDDEQFSYSHQFPSFQALNSEAMKAAMASMCDTETQFKMHCLRPFKKHKQSSPVDQDILIELYALSCLLRFVGRFVQQNSTWKQGKYLIEKNNFWKFLEEVQPWMIHHKQRVEHKIEQFSYDDAHFYVKNFDQLYLRLRDLLGHFIIQPQKIQKIFKKACFSRKKTKRILRCDPKTLNERRKLISYNSRRKFEQKRHKKSYGMRKNTRQKYQNMKFWADTKNLVFKTKQIFRKKPSRTHRKQVEKKRQQLMEEYCMTAIADDMTASVILGSFKTWEKSIKQIAPDQRYLYIDSLPNLPLYTVWYPVHFSFLKERKWYFPHIYNKCQGFFASPLPVYTEDELFKRIVCWYRKNNLFIAHSLVQAEEFDELRAIFDHPYRIRYEEKQRQMKSAAIEINPEIRFHEDVESSSSENQSSDDEGIVFDRNVPRRGNKQKWSIIHKNQNKSEFICCGLCEEEVNFPCPCCKQCLGLFHQQCRQELNEKCLCQRNFDIQYREKMMRHTCKQAQRLAKHVELVITKPSAASMMEKQFQQRDLHMHLPSGSSNSMWSRPQTIKYDESSQICFLKAKTMKIIEKFETQEYVFPGIIKQVQGKGRGLIASRLIKKNQIVANYSGSLFTETSTRRIFPSCNYVYSFHKGKTPFSSWNIIPWSTASLGMFINHSKENANVKPGKYWTPKGPLILFLAARQIKMNEEILYDYGDHYNGRELFKQDNQT